MKIATVFYDKRGIIVQPEYCWNKPHPKSSVLTTEGGYWHLCEKNYHSSQMIGGLDDQGRITQAGLEAAERERDIALTEAIETIQANNGTVLSMKPIIRLYRQGRGYPIEPDQFDQLVPGDDVVFRWRMLYVVEEPDRSPFIRFAARIDRIGVDPDFEYPYDGVADQGPDYTTPRSQQLANNSAFVDLEDADMSIPVNDNHLRTPQLVPEDYPDF